MDELIYNAIDLLKAMIAIPSISRDEDKVANIIESSINSAGYKAMRQGNNVWCFGNDFSPLRPSILLNSHIDTVKPVDAWTYNPYAATEIDDKILGLGSNDAGASLVSLFATFIYISSRPQSYNLIFLASCEEEVGGENGIESVIPLLPPISVAIVGEPTEMQPAIAEKGLMVLDGVIHGVSGHAARNEGLNAIYKAIDVVASLKDLIFPRISPLLGPIKVTVTQIESGTQHNVIPDLCKIVVDVRTTEAYSNTEVLEYIRKAVPACIFTPRSTRLNSSKIDIAHPLVQRMITLGAAPFGSPTLSDQALMPFQSLKLGPGSSSRSHTANEYITTSEIREAISTYIALLNNLNL
ncbi:MAG: M20 family metallo-hydrolase [Muribaculaceae bacterium]